MKHEVSSVGLLILLTAGQVSANPPGAPADDHHAHVDVTASPRPVSERERQALVEKGKSLARDGQYAAALEALRVALVARRDPGVLLWVGYSQEQSGALLDGKASYSEAKSIAHAGKLAAEERSADRALHDIAAKIPRITIKLSSGVGMKVWIDGVEILPPEGGAEVDPGTHEVLVRGSGRYPYRTEVVARLGEVNVVEPVLNRITPPPPPPPPPLNARNDSRARVLLAGGIVTGVALALGTGFAIASEVKRQERDDASTRCLRGPDCEPYNAPERARGGFLTASLVSFVAAGAIGSGTLVYSLMTSEDTSRGEVKATASIGPGRVAGAIEFSW